MSDNELRDRIAVVIYRKLDTQHGSSSAEIAQAVIDDLGLEVEYWLTYSGNKWERASGKWEEA